MVVKAEETTATTSGATTPASTAGATPTATPATTTTTPAPTTYTATWASGAIPIDPALQQQTQHATTSPYPHYQFTSHYPQAAYTTHYQPYAPPTTAASAQRTATTPITAYQSASYAFNPSTTSTATTTVATANAVAANASAIDTSDIATLNDALGSTGVDLKAEEESLQRSQHDHTSAYRSYEDRTRRQTAKPAFDTRFLGTTMRTIGTNQKVTRIPDEAVNYLALALRARLQDLITSMISAANHRNDTQFDRPASFFNDSDEQNKTPMWSIVVRNDVAKQLAALEKVERDEELRVRKDRKERAEMTAAHAAALAAQAGAAASNLDGTEEEGGQVKKKRKKDGPGVTARNMSEDVRKKMSNAVATQAAGLGKYSWMTAANASTPPPKPKPAATTTTTTTKIESAGSPAALTSATTGGTSASSAANGGGSWARPYISTTKKTVVPGSAEDDGKMLITMRDALFVVEKERGHGGGRGAARGWS